METLRITARDKAGVYEELLPQIASLIAGEPDLTANLANTAAVLKEAFGFFWVGFYWVKPALPPESGDPGSVSESISGESGGQSGLGPDPGSEARTRPSELVLGPFQGPIACTRIPYGRGVCGTAWKERRTLVVPDVEQFPGHIACSSLSRSEIVVPVFAAPETSTGCRPECGMENRSDTPAGAPAGRTPEERLPAVLGVLDIDSTETETFDETDRKYLEQIVALFAKSKK